MVSVGVRGGSKTNQALRDADYSDDFAWNRLLRDLHGDEARLLPRAFAEALPVVAVMLPRDRLLTAFRMAVAVDIVECVGSLAYLSEQFGDADAAIVAAALAANPSVHESIRARVAEVGRYVAMSEQQRLVFDVMRGAMSADDPRLTPGLRRLITDRWRGRDQASEAPFVVLEESAATPAAAMWLLAAELHAGGAIVRRAFEDMPAPGTGFDRAIAVGWTERSTAGAGRDRYVRVPAELFNRQNRLDALAAISQATFGAQGMPLTLSGAPRFDTEIVASHAATNATASASLATQRDVQLVRQAAYTAVIAYITDLVHSSAIQFEMLLSVGQQSVEDARLASVVGEGIRITTEGQLEQAATEGVRAAIAELVKGKKLRHNLGLGADVYNKVP
ncbi:MAG: hypothetical protein QOK28_3356 [Actinomycetota bacterium]